MVGLLLTLGLLAGASPLAAENVQESLTALNQDGHTIEGRMNWSKDILVAYGEAVAPADVTSAVQRRLLGFRAAKVVAYRNLLELVGQVHVDSQTLVGDVMVKSDTIRTQVSGILRGARVVPGSQEEAGGLYRIALQIELHDAFADAVLPVFPDKRSASPVAEPQASAPADTMAAPDALAGPNPADSSTAANADSLTLAAVFEPPLPYTGLLVDARGLDLQPSMAPRVITVDGREVYSPAFVERTYAAHVGVVGYYGDMEAALASDRLGDEDAHPLIVEAVDVAGLYRADPVIGREDGIRVAMADAESGFLGQCRVAFVLGERPVAPDSAQRDSTLLDSTFLDSVLLDSSLLDATGLDSVDSALTHSEEATHVLPDTIDTSH